LKYPAIDIDGIDGELLLALVDDFSPTAADIDHSPITIYFSDSARRDLARDAIARAHPHAVVTAREVDDEDWARRSQENLSPVTVGRITIAPSDTASLGPSPGLPGPPITITIAPSMGFGTGHHATTRLCLRALQDIDVTGAFVVDAGTGSGILAIAARLLGASDAVGIDDDRDAIAAATENLDRNPGVDRVRFEVADLRSHSLPAADVITANLTGALLVRSAGPLLRALKPGGSLIVSGLQHHERDDVVKAFASAKIAWEQSEDEWDALVFRP
jgi:ribosomal protein L11 methyltransferase